MSARVPDLTVVGAINLDLVATVHRAPGRGETVADGDLQRQPGGKGANQAAAASRLGASVAMIGAVGTDDTGDYLLASLHDAGVDTALVQRQEGVSGTALIVVDRSGENSIVVCGEANNRIDAGRVRVHPGSALLAQLEIDQRVTATAAAQTSGFVAVNASPVVEIDADLLRRADLVIVNEHEYDQLPSVRDARLIAVTLGAAGARLLERGRTVATATSPRVDVRNTVGAGDAFAAAITVALMRGEGHEGALRRACAVGAAAVQDERSQPLLHDLTTY